mmetsp:Transcript_12649/g.32510  ORF Transcript_12649/g.32510 Transcript_12649/m.32510 type:complete len:243 (+) Transcript_12649:1775-2503(+)
MRPLQGVDLGALDLACGDASVQLLQLGVGVGDFLGVLVCGVVQQLLQVADALRHRCMVRVSRLRLGGELGVLRGERLQLPGVLLRRVAQHLLDVVHPLFQGCVLRLQARLVTRQADLPLVQLAHGFVLVLTDRQATVQLVQLAVRDFQCLRVLVGRVAEQLLKIGETLSGGGVRLLQSLELLSMPIVLVRRVPCELLQEEHALSHGGVGLHGLLHLAVRHAEALLHCLVVRLQDAHLLSQHG